MESDGTNKKSDQSLGSKTLITFFSGSYTFHRSWSVFSDSPYQKLPPKPFHTLSRSEVTYRVLIFTCRTLDTVSLRIRERVQKIQFVTLWTSKFEVFWELGRSCRRTEIKSKELASKSNIDFAFDARKESGRTKNDGDSPSVWNMGCWINSRYACNRNKERCRWDSYSM